MASSGSDAERRAPAGALAGPGSSAEDGSHPWPAQGPGGTDPLALPRGRADSARSSGSPSTAEGAAPSRCVHGLGAGGRAHGDRAAERRGHAPARGAAAPRPPPPSPPRRLDSYRVTRHLENPPGRSERAARPPEGEDASWGRGRREVTEQDAAAAGRRAPEYKAVSSSALTNGLSKPQNQGLKTGENGERHLSQEPGKRSNAHVFSRPSSVIFQEYLKTDSGASAPKILPAFNAVHAHKIPEEMNSKAHSLPHTSPNTVNDTQENKQCQCIVHKQNSRAADLQSPVPEAGQGKRSLPRAHCPAHAELHQDWGRDVLEDSPGLECMESTLTITTTPEKQNSRADQYGCCDSEGEMGNDVWEPILNQQAKMQRPPVSPSLGGAEPEYPLRGDLGQGHEQCCDGTNQTARFRPKENATSHFLNEFNKENQINNVNPGLVMHLEEEKTAPPVCVHKHQPGLPKQPERHLQGAPASGQINRQTTPLLYYLSGGKTTDILHQRKHIQHPEDLSSLPKKSSASNYSASSRSSDVQRESNWLPKPEPTRQCIADDPNEAEDAVLGSPGSPVDESFNNHYREQLKVAQKRVLRETSFKRKDLQMSLPIRLRKKPSQRSSVEHLRSFSLSSANEDAKLVPSPPPHVQLVEHFSKDAEIRRTQLGRIGGRKRVTKEQKNLCFSEPEKLNELEDKDVPWSQARDEVTELDTAAAGRRALESRGRALSSSGISKTELKQIQHTALVEYMERKISRRPGGPARTAPPTAPAQKRPSYARWPSGKACDPSQSSRSQGNEVFSPVFSEEEFPEVFTPMASATPPSPTCRCSRSPAAILVPSEPPPCSGGAQGRCGSRSASAESLPPEGAPAEPHEGSVSAPPRAQESSGCASSAAPPARSRDPCPGCPSFHDAEKDECHQDRDDNVAGSACCQDRKDLTPETSVLVPKNGSTEEPQAEQECGLRSPNSSALVKGPGQRLEADDAAGARVEAACCRPPHGGERSAGNGSAAAESAARSSREPLLPGHGTGPPERGPLPPDEQRYEELAKEIVAKDGSLAEVLVPRPMRVTALDLMEGLFPVNLSMLDKSHRKRRDVQHVQENHRKGNEELTAESPEAEHDAEQGKGDPVSKGNQTLNSSRDSTNDLDDITSKKMELMWSLRWKERALRQERELVLAESRACAERGRALEALLRPLCKPSEFERYVLFIGDLEKVVSLLLCLSSRLARVQNAMRRVDGNTDAEEKQSLNERHKLLSRQREDAKDLKENLDRRERVVSGVLAKYLPEEQLQDYRHFVQVKTSLLIEQKDLEEQIKLLEEQLESLEKSIPL